MSCQIQQKQNEQQHLPPSRMPKKAKEGKKKQN